MVLRSALILCFLSALSLSLEVLPPYAYLNRTVYPALKDYSQRKPELAIGLISDLQYADQPESKRRHFRMSLAKLQQAVDEMNVNRTHLDMVFHLGDLVDHSMKTYLPKLQPILDSIKYPFYQVLGNHDFLMSNENDFDSIHQLLKMPGKYYSLNAGPKQSYRLVVLDGNDISFYATKVGSTKRKEAETILGSLQKRRAKNANKFNGALGSEQIQWMKQQLGEACRMGQRAVIMVHHPMRPKDEPTNLWNDIQIVPIVASFHCVAAVINGHAHKLLYDFHYTRFRNVWYITFGGMVQSPFTSFGFADFYEDVLHVHGLIFGRQIELHFNLSYRERPESSEGGSSPSPVTVAGRAKPTPKTTREPASALFSSSRVPENLSESSRFALPGREVVFFWVATLAVVGAIVKRLLWK